MIFFCLFVGVEEHRLDGCVTESSLLLASFLFWYASTTLAAK